MALAAGGHASSRAGDATAMAQLREELWAARDETESLREREAGARARFCAVEAELGRLRASVAEADQLRTRLLQVEIELAQCGEHERGRQDAERELAIARHAAQQLSTRQTAAVEQASKASWERDFQQGCFEARIEAVELQAEMAGRKQIHSMEQQLAVAQSQSAHWRAMADHRADKSVALEGQCQARAVAWSSRCTSRERLLLLHSAFRQWAGDAFDKGRRELWDMHVHYLHKQQAGHAAHRRDLRSHHNFTLTTVMQHFASRDNVILASRCLNGWSAFTMNQRHKQDIASREVKVQFLCNARARCATLSYGRHSFETSYLCLVVALTLWRASLRMRSADRRVAAARAGIVIVGELASVVLEHGALGVVVAFWANAVRATKRETLLWRHERAQAQLRGLANVIYQDSRLASDAAVLYAWCTVARVERARRRRVLLVERIVRACGGARSRATLAVVLEGWRQRRQRAAHIKRSGAWHAHCARTEECDWLGTVVRAWRARVTGSSGALVFRNARGLSASGVVEHIERRQKHATCLVVAYAGKLVKACYIEPTWAAWVLCTQLCHAQRNLELQSCRSEARRDGVVEGALSALAATEEKWLLRSLLAHWRRDAARRRLQDETLTSTSTLAGAARVYERVGERFRCCSESLASRLLLQRDTLAVQALFRAWRRLFEGTRARLAADDRDESDALRLLHMQVVVLLSLRVAAHKDALGLHACLAGWQRLVPSTASGKAALRRRLATINQRHENIRARLSKLLGDDGAWLDASVVFSAWRRHHLLSKAVRTKNARDEGMLSFCARWEANFRQNTAALAFRIWDLLTFGKPSETPTEERFAMASKLMRNKERHDNEMAVIKVAWSLWSVELSNGRAARQQGQVQHMVRDARLSAHSQCCSKLLFSCRNRAAERQALRAWCGLASLSARAKHGGLLLVRSAINAELVWVETSLHWTFHIWALCAAEHLLATQRKEKAERRGVYVGRIELAVNSLAHWSLQIQFHAAFKNWFWSAHANHHTDLREGVAQAQRTWTMSVDRLGEGFARDLRLSILSRVMDRWSHAVECSWRLKRLRRSMSGWLMGQDAFVRMTILLRCWGEVVQQGRDLDRNASHNELVAALLLRRNLTVDKMHVGHTLHSEDSLCAFVLHSWRHQVTHDVRDGQFERLQRESSCASVRAISSRHRVVQLLCGERQEEIVRTALVRWSLQTAEAKRALLGARAVQQASGFRERARCTMEHVALLDEVMCVQWAFDHWREHLAAMKQEASMRFRDLASLDRHQRVKTLHLNRREQAFARASLQAWRAGCVVSGYSDLLDGARTRLKSERTTWFWTDVSRSAHITFACWWALLQEARAGRDAGKACRARQARGLEGYLARHAPEVCRATFEAWRLEVIVAVCGARTARLQAARACFFARADAGAACRRAVFCAWNLVASTEARASRDLRHREGFAEASRTVIHNSHEAMLANVAFFSWAYMARLTNVKARAATSTEAAHLAHMRSAAQYHLRLEQLSLTWTRTSEVGLLAAMMRLWQIEAGSTRREAFVEDCAAMDVYDTHVEAQYKGWKVERCLTAALLLHTHVETHLLLRTTTSAWRADVAEGRVVAARSRHLAALSRAVDAHTARGDGDFAHVLFALAWSAWYAERATSLVEGHARRATRRDSTLERVAALWSASRHRKLWQDLIELVVLSWRAATISASAERRRKAQAQRLRGIVAVTICRLAEAGDPAALASIMWQWRAEALSAHRARAVAILSARMQALDARRRSEVASNAAKLGNLHDRCHIYDVLADWRDAVASSRSERHKARLLAERLRHARNLDGSLRAVGNALARHMMHEVFVAMRQCGAETEARRGHRSRMDVVDLLLRTKLAFHLLQRMLTLWQHSTANSRRMVSVDTLLSSKLDAQHLHRLVLAWAQQAHTSRLGRASCKRMEAIEAFLDAKHAPHTLHRLLAAWAQGASISKHELREAIQAQEHALMIKEQQEAHVSRFEEQKQAHARRLEEEQETHVRLLDEQQDAAHRLQEERERELEEWGQKTERWAQKLRCRHEVSIEVLVHELDCEEMRGHLCRYLHIWRIAVVRSVRARERELMQPPGSPFDAGGGSSPRDVTPRDGSFIAVDSLFNVGTSSRQSGSPADSHKARLEAELAEARVAVEGPWRRLQETSSQLLELHQLEDQETALPGGLAAPRGAPAHERGGLAHFRASSFGGASFEGIRRHGR